MIRKKEAEYVEEPLSVDKSSLIIDGLGGTLLQVYFESVKKYGKESEQVKKIYKKICNTMKNKKIKPTAGHYIKSKKTENCHSDPDDAECDI